MLFELLRVALCGAKSVNIEATIEWAKLYTLARRQGVTAIVWQAVKQLGEEGTIPDSMMPDRALKLQWALTAENIAKRYRKQAKAAEELSEAYHNRGISTNVLKGLAISGYYPTPEHRECGDLDCFLTSKDGNGTMCCRYDEGNKIAAEIGAKVDIGFYKHSHINYRGLMVENHAFCTAIRGSRDRKALERHLQSLLATKPSTPINDTPLLKPCADFNALFLTAHSMGHYLTEGIKLRHILDWAMLLKAEQENIDWQSFYSWCDRMHYTKFADALTTIAVRHLGLEITNPAIHHNSDLADRVLEDILFSERSVHNTKASKMKKRLMILRARLFGGWRYKELYEKSALLDTMSMVAGFIFERKPKL